MKGYRPAGASNIPAYPCIRKEYQFPADLAESLAVWTHGRKKWGLHILATVQWVTHD